MVKKSQDTPTEMNVARLAEIVGDCLLGAEHIASLLGFPSVNSVYIAMHRGVFPVQPIRVGRRLRWRASDVRAFLASGQQGSSEGTRA